MKYLYLVVMLYSVSVFSQEKVVLEGRIVGDSIMESSVHLVNLSSRIGTVNDENGAFKIQVRENDSLVFSSVQYELLEMVVSKKMVEEKQIKINLKSIELEEVNISDINLSGNLERDVTDIKTTYYDFGLPQRTKPKLTSVERKIYTASSGPVDLIVNSLNGKLKMLKKHNENMKRKSLIETALAGFPMDFFVDTLKLQEDEVINFLYYCAETDPGFRFLVNSDYPLDLIEYYEKMVPEFFAEK